MDEKYDRQMGWFGSEGQTAIGKTKVAIVGVGGTGSHIIQQLAYLGVNSFILIDNDNVSKTNLNRLIGAVYEDIGIDKVYIGKRLVESINPKSEIEAISDTLRSPSGLQGIINSDFVFGCVDKDGIRLILTEVCKAYNIPYIDLATEIYDDAWGGRIVFSDNEYGCLICRDVLSQEAIRKDLSSNDDIEIESKIYGVPVQKLSTTGPSVISLNGIIASLAVSEFMMHVTQKRQVKRYLEYKGNMGIVIGKNELQNNCYYCTNVTGIKDKLDIEQYFTSANS